MQDVVEWAGCEEVVAEYVVTSAMSGWLLEVGENAANF